MNTFDEGKTWDDVRRRLASRMRRKFPRVHDNTVDDAVAEAIADLIDYWCDLPSSTQDGLLVFNFAIRRGDWFATQYIIQEFRRLDTEAYLNDYGLRTDGGMSVAGSGEANPDDEDISDVPIFDFIDAAMLPEDVIGERDEQERARDMLAQMSPKDLEDFFTYLGEDTVPSIAEKLGVSERTVQRRRAAKRNNLRRLGREYGLS